MLELLRASHIKPWRDCDNRERLDPYNGLLLSPQYDAVFDKGFITFNDDGKMVLSEELKRIELSLLGVEGSAEIRDLQARHLAYLRYHRENVFRDSVDS